MLKRRIFGVVAATTFLGVAACADEPVDEDTVPPVVEAPAPAIEPVPPPAVVPVAPVGADTIAQVPIATVPVAVDTNPPAPTP